MMLHYEERGAGRPVLALHGWTPDHRLMLGCLEPVFATRPGYRRLYPDLPGMGKSFAPPAIASSDDILAAVLEFADATIGDEPFLLLGESYGGYLARAIAHARPDQVLGLALICPTGTQVEHANRRLPEPELLRPDPAVVATLPAAAVADYVELAVVQSAETARRYLDEVQPGLDAADREAMERIRGDWTLSADPESGPPYPGPTLILTGRQDAIVGYLDQFDLLPHYPRASFALLDLAGHNLQIEQPALFDALIGEWLDRVAFEAGA